MGKLLLILILGGAIAGELAPRQPPLLIDSSPAPAIPLDAGN